MADCKGIFGSVRYLEIESVMRVQSRNGKMPNMLFKLSMID